MDTQELYEEYSRIIKEKGTKEVMDAIVKLSIASTTEEYVDILISLYLQGGEDTLDTIIQLKQDGIMDELKYIR